MIPFLNIFYFLSGDINLNPEPGYPCNGCKNVIKDVKIFFSNTCKYWVHKKYCDISHIEYKKIKEVPNQKDFNCVRCRKSLNEHSYFSENEINVGASYPECCITETD